MIISTIDQLKAKIEATNILINDLKEKIEAKQLEINSFEYECSDDEYDEMIDECNEEINIFGMTYSASEVLKRVDPIAYRCGKSDFEANYDLDHCEEYCELHEELQGLEIDLENLEAELDELEVELEELEG